MWTRERLVEHVAADGSANFLLFWGHTPKVSERVDRSCLSQWFARGFAIDGIFYPTAEHFMMAEKARLFGDNDALTEILAAETPAEVKKIGRSVRGFDASRWANVGLEAVVRANVEKFSQHADLAAFLCSTGNDILVEASPQDTIWGIGLRASDPDALIPSRWRGANLLGFALMEVRDRLRGGTNQPG